MRHLGLRLSICSFLLIFINTTTFSQTAVNFTADDCHAVNHDLFTELNSGKVIVIAWVMPCAGCISGALAGYSAAESFASSNPGQVLFYLVDDYGNTSCSSLGAWGDNNGMTNATPFSNAAISMADYGVAGMPKVVVLGGTNHTVFYNQNNSNINQTDVTTAISNALAGNSSGLVEGKMEICTAQNPVNDKLTIHFGNTDETSVKLKVISETGQEVLNIESKINENKVDIDVRDLESGIYFLHFADNQGGKSIKVVIAH